MAIPDPASSNILAFFGLTGFFTLFLADRNLPVIDKVSGTRIFFLRKR
ncbi:MULTISPECIES: hypothetical protein [Nitrosomonas]|nr:MULTISPECIES: hypothetical protein [Nitrosomonas]QOJ09298.1 MAG: hypothetical protein HRU73_07410 [Nitrosomonas sp. H1_AOB3]HRN82242.1 hypothetical protein [Nitrosomonas europaea]HRO57122.1 hypothetical protein [Nitrosomonas europaea]HRQ08751.1 hypothetical protein [Nitrosomonas europaea]HUM74698.1 hypothetical protein [Nitrosomonas europaea]